MVAPGTGVERSPRRAAVAGVPLVAWLLFAAAVVTAVAEMMAYNYLVPWVAIVPWQIFGTVNSARTFLLACALVAGAGAWPNGRRWLLAAALLFAFSGLLDLGYYAWLWSQGGLANIGPDLEAFAPFMNARAAISQAMQVAATIAVGAGLWQARPRATRAGRRRIGVMAGIGVVGMLAMAGPLAWLGHVPLQPPEAITSAVLVSLLMGATAGVALVAVAAMPRAGWLPELLVAAGAGLEVVTGAWTTWLSIAIGGMQNIPPEWNGLAFVLPARLGVIGMLLLVIGLASGHLAPWASGPEPERAVARDGEPGSELT